MNEKKWIEAKEYLSINGHQVDDLLFQLSSSLISYYSGNYKESAKLTLSFLNKYGDALGPGKFNFMALLLNNYRELQEYQKAVDICDEIIRFAQANNFPQDMIIGIEQAKDAMVKNINYPKTEVCVTHTGPILLKGSFDEGIYSEVLCNGKSTKVLIDTGASLSVIGDKMAKELNVRFLKKIPFY
ncbi:MAG: aspartyl protease family protein [Tannerellaceae bacterium]|nr:aspartyl protease family protein [Tannerellaceae bacterium]